MANSNSFFTEETVGHQTATNYRPNEATNRCAEACKPPQPYPKPWSEEMCLEQWCMENVHAQYEPTLAPALASGRCRPQFAAKANLKFSTTRPAAYCSCWIGRPVIISKVSAEWGAGTGCSM